MNALPQQVPPPAQPPTLASVIIERIRAGASLEETKEYYKFIRQIQADEAKAAFDADFVQLKLRPIPKGGKTRMPDGKDRPYPRLEDILVIEPDLAERNFRLRFDIAEETDVAVAIDAILVHRAGHSVSTRKKLPLDKGGAKNIVQAYGSTQTYAMRYAVMALLSLKLGEDDDATSTGDSKRDNPHVNRPEDFVDVPSRGDPDTIPPTENPNIKPLPKKDARADYSKLQMELYAIRDLDKLKAWGIANKDRIASQPLDWQDIFRGYYRNHLISLRNAAVEGPT